MNKKSYKFAWVLVLGAMIFAGQLLAAKAPVLHGNVQSHIFHAQHCQHYSCKNCVKVFETREQAIKQGYRPCKICKP